MKGYLERLYLAGRLDNAGLDNAVARGWITQADADEIRDAAQPADEQQVTEPQP